MGTFHCPSACDDLCASIKKAASSRPGRFLFYPGLMPAERKLVDQNPKEAIVVFIQKTRAELSSSRNFPVQGFNDESDAFWHYVWAGLLTKELGAERAQLYLDAHEENPLQPSTERAMDLANNRGGILGAQKLLKNNKSFDLRSLELTGYSFSEEFFGAKFMSLKEAQKKWGSSSFEAKNFKKSSEKEKGAMAVQAVEKKAFVGQDMLKVREQMGDPDSYFFSDTIYAYIITSNVKPKQESWQLVFSPDQDLKKVMDVKIHKKCCYETPEWAK